MMIKTLMLLSAAVVLVAAHETHDHSHDHDEKKQPDRGIARLEGKFLNSVVSGDLTFTMASKDELVITGKITGMPDGLFGMNIHESGDISDGCTKTGGHFNPHGHEHGHPEDEHRHVGDLGNIESKSGVANIKISERLAKLWGTEGVIGRSIVLSSQKDDHGRTEHHLSKYDGNTGDRVACGVIGVL